MTSIIHDHNYAKIDPTQLWCDEHLQELCEEHNTPIIFCYDCDDNRYLTYGQCFLCPWFYCNE